MPKLPEVSIPADELNSFDLPPICVVTGRTGDVSFRKVKFAWASRWYALLVPINLVVAAIVISIVTKRVSGELPFTDEGYSRWRRSVWLRGFSGFGVALMTMMSLGGLAAERPIFGVVSLLFTTGSLVAFVRLGQSMVTCKRIKNGQVTLQIPSSLAQSRILERLHGGAASQALPPHRTGFAVSA